MKAYPNLTKPITIGKITVKNRMFMAPMDTGFGNTPYGVFTEDGIEYFVRRAEGGFGLLFSGGTNADTQVDGVDGILNHAQEFIRVGQSLNERLRAYGTKMFIQLSMNTGRNAGLKTPSPLPVLGNPKATTKVLTVDEIHRKVDEMGKAAKLCKQAGYAGVDIHALHWGHLLDSFALSFMNHREDEYGGSLENRLRIAKEIVKTIKEQCGQDYPVTIRFAVKSYMKDFDKASFDGSKEVGRTPEEAIEIAMLLDAFDYYGTTVLTSTRLDSVTDEGAVITAQDGEKKVIPADNVIISVGYRPRKSFAEELTGSKTKVYEIGDGSQVGNIMTCIQDAYEIAHNL